MTFEELLRELHLIVFDTVISQVVDSRNKLKDLKKLCENLSDVFLETNSDDSDFKVKSNNF